MKRRIRWIAALLVVAAAAGLIYWQCAVSQPSGCPPELLRHYLQQDHILGRPAQVRELVRPLNGYAYTGNSLIVTTYTPAGEPLHNQLWSTMGKRPYFQDTTYSYDRRSSLIGQIVRLGSKDHSPSHYSFLYLPAERRIEVDIAQDLPRRSSGPVPDGMKPDSIIIRLDHANRYIDQVDTHGGDMLYRATFEYDGSGHVCREVWLFPGLRKSRPKTYQWGFVDKHDSRGNVIERRMFDATGRYTSTLSNTYKYDSVGNWIEERTTVSSLGKGKNKGPFRSIRTRTITYRR